MIIHLRFQHLTEEKLNSDHKSNLEMPGPFGILKCRIMAFNQRWNALDSPDIFYLLISKLPDGIMEGSNRKVLNIK